MFNSNIKRTYTPSRRRNKSLHHNHHHHHHHSTIILLSTHWYTHTGRCRRQSTVDADAVVVVVRSWSVGRLAVRCVNHYYHCNCTTALNVCIVFRLHATHIPSSSPPSHRTATRRARYTQWSVALCVVLTPRPVLAQPGRMSVQII